MKNLICAVFATLFFTACSDIAPPEPTTTLSEASTSTPSTVTIEKIDNAFQLHVNGKPYKVRGVGMDFNEGEYVEALANAGGNSFRTWSPAQLEKELQLAAKHNMMVAVGLGVEKQLEGFDYDNEEEVAHQFERVKNIVDTYKNHPNVLCWVVVNEANLLINDDGSLGIVNPKIYDAVNDIIEYIHETDPNHPVTYTFAGIFPEHIDVALARTPTVDFVSFQVYKDLEKIYELLEPVNLELPFMITEYGPVGHWEQPSTDWGREIEEPSALKASGLAERIRYAFSANPSGKHIGDFAFLWGQKQERTPTWYGMLDKQGRQDARADELTHYWTGSYPENRAPLTRNISLEGKLATENIHIEASKNVSAEVIVSDPNGDPLTTRWEIMREVQTRSQGGLFEQRPETISFEQVANAKTDAGFSIEFVAPQQPGEYRLFAYTYDDKNKVGTANIPFYVD